MAYILATSQKWSAAMVNTPPEFWGLDTVSTNMSKTCFIFLFFVWKIMHNSCGIILDYTSLRTMCIELKLQLDYNFYF